MISLSYVKNFILLFWNKSNSLIRNLPSWYVLTFFLSGIVHCAHTCSSKQNYDSVSHLEIFLFKTLPTQWKAGFPHPSSTSFPVLSLIPTSYFCPLFPSQCSPPSPFLFFTNIISYLPCCLTVYYEKFSFWSILSIV